MLHLLRSWFSKPRRPSTPARRARPRSARLALEGLEERVVPSLYHVSDTTAYPYRAVVHLQTTFPNGAVETGTGTLIDRFHVLTAGHMVYNYSDGGFASSIAVTAGEDGSYSPYGTAYMTYERTYNSFITDDRSNSNGHSAGDGDVGLVTLDRTLGDSTGWFGWWWTTNDGFFSGRTFSTAGYPGTNGYPGNSMYVETGSILGAYSSTALYFSQGSLTEVPGQSGSALYSYYDGYGNYLNYPLVYGVLDVSNSTYGYAERLTAAISNDLTGWMSSDLIPTATSVSASTYSPTLGQSVTLTAKVTANGAGQSYDSPTGTVYFYDNGTYLGSSSVSVSGGVGTASFTTSGLGPGSHSIYAYYGGNGSYKAATSSYLYETVSKASTSTYVYASTSTPAAGQSVNLSAYVYGGSGAPTGWVYFYDGSTYLGAASLTGYGSTGVATLTTSFRQVGSHSIRAYYAGDSYDSASWSSASSEYVTATPLGTTFVLMNYGYLYRVDDAHGWTLLATNVQRISNTGNDGHGNAMVDVTFNWGGAGYTYEYRDTGYSGSWNYLTYGVTSAAVGFGVSDVVIYGTYLYQYNDASASWAYLNAGVSQISAGSDAYGQNMVDVLFSNGGAYEWSNYTGWHYLGSGVTHVSAGQNGVSALLFSYGGSLYLYREAGNSWQYLLGSATNAAVGTDLYGNVQVEVSSSNYVSYQFNSASGWSYLNSYIESFSQPNGGDTYVEFYGGYLYKHDRFGYWTYLASNVA